MVQGQIVLVATDNTTVVAYINKEGGMRSGHFVPFYGDFFVGAI